MQISTYRTWAGSFLAPRERLLPGLGTRLGGYPRLAASVLVALRSLPGVRLRAAACRNVARPLVRRMSARLEIPVAGGYRMIVDPADVIGRSLATSGVWEPHVTGVFRELLSPGNVCVDIGANIGYYTILASRLVGESGCVYALEPATDVYAALSANLELNGVSNTTALCVAAGAAEGTAHLVRREPGNIGSSSLRRRHDALAPEGQVPRQRLLSSYAPRRRCCRVPSSLACDS